MWDDETLRQKAWEQGFDDGERGVPLGRNPYIEGEPGYEDWINGWNCSALL